jgi:hypothetical protein
LHNTSWVTGACQRTHRPSDVGSPSRPLGDTGALAIPIGPSGILVDTGVRDDPSWVRWPTIWRCCR